MTIGMQVSLVPKEHVPQVWGQVKDMIQRAADYTNGRYTTDDAYEYVMEYGYPLWIVFNEESVKGAVVTYFGSYPRKKTLCIMFLGGDDGWSWKEPLLETLNRWAFDNGCDTIEASGRPGWARVLKNNGFTPLWQTFEMPVQPVELGA